MLRRRSFLPVYAGIIEPKHFGTPLFRDTAGVMMNMWRTYKVVPTFETLEQHVHDEVQRRRDRLPKGIAEEWFALLDDLRRLSLSDAEIVIQQVVTWVQDQVIKAAIVQCGNIIDHAERTGERRYSEIRSIFANALQVGMDSSANRIDYFEDTHSRLLRNFIDDAQYGLRIPLMLQSIDNIIDGGPSRQELVVWASPTGRGKTYALGWTTKAALYQGKNVAFFTAEMSKGAIAARLDRSVSHLPKSDLRTNSGMTLALRRIRAMETYRGSLLIWDISGRDATVEKVHNTLERERSESGWVPDEILIDYPGVMRGSRQFRESERRHEQAEIYRDCRTLGKEWDAVMHVPMQTNRGSLSRKIITIKDLAECFEVAWHADLIFALCRTAEEEQQDMMRIFIAKNRDGRDHFSAPFYFNKETGNFVTAGDAALATEESLVAAAEQCTAEAATHA